MVLREHSAVELGVTGKDFLGDFPSLVLGIGDSNSETIIRFQTGNKIEIPNVGAENGGSFDEVKMGGQRLTGWIKADRSDSVTISHWFILCV